MAVTLRAAEATDADEVAALIARSKAARRPRGRGAPAVSRDRAKCSNSLGFEQFVRSGSFQAHGHAATRERRRTG